ncbi:hypothetical protein [Nostoc parmelioides]|uniref:Uncharacterized protein n=1 Tax=Nostoc parmelioides FACHB-3921 TaxID=2692909 RepID=A0ABR8BQK3_9NOSO|nr:hypothetical protein [Nostoc parmelioides]MBD2255599.1 hypothetical protein [Nostoc parmelioides FACHB-3921]
MNSCQVCGGEFWLNVVSDRSLEAKYLRAGCCDSPLSPCPSPDELLRSSSINLEERLYLIKVAKLEWFSGQVAAVLLQIEGKVKAAGEVAV